MVNRNAAKSPMTTPQQAEKRAETDCKTTSGKKLKQTRLSFASKDTAKPAGDGLRKRKLSSPENEPDRSVKIVRREEESGDPVVVLDDDDDVKVVEEPKAKDPEPETPATADNDNGDDDVEMVEIIENEDSNSVAPSSAAETSLVEEVIEEDDDDDEEEEDQAEESIVLNNSSSDDADPNADLLLPPSNVSGKPLTPGQLEKQMLRKSKAEERLLQKQEREQKKKELEEAKRKEREEKKAALQLEKQREKDEREAAKQREKDEREAAKQREKDEREAAKQKEKDEREAAKQREREEKEAAKAQKLQQKEEERRKKEDEKRQKEEEKRLKEEEEENKKKRVSAAFTKFFKVAAKTDTDGKEATPQSDPSASADVVEVVNQYFMPFAIKGDMKLAPCVRRVLTKEAKSALEKVLTGAGDEKAAQQTHTYIKSLKTKSHVPLKGIRTWTVSDSSDDDSEDDLMVVDDNLAHKVEEVKPKKQKYRAKYLMFKENRRPAYYGTWTKKSKFVGPRRPFGKDEKIFDYEVDSDDEWEEEEPGESLHGSDDEKEKESEDDYEVDNEFFVPHGHLSDEEMQDEDNELDDNSPEAQKAKLKILQAEFNDEMKKKTEKIKPRLIGCIWVDEKGQRPESCQVMLWDMLQFRAVLSAGPIVLRAPPADNASENGGDEDADNEENDEKLDKRKGMSLTEGHVESLVKLVHGNLNSNKFIVKEFQKYLEKIGVGAGAGDSARGVVTNMSILRKIKEVAKWESGCWVVQKEFLDKYGLGDLSLENKWEYTLTPKRLKMDKKQAAPNSPQVTAPSQQQAPVNPKTPVRPPVEKESPPSAAKQAQQSSAQKTSSKNSITQFTKVLTTEEKQKQFKAISVPSPKQNQIPTTANENKAPASQPAPVVVKPKPAATAAANTATANTSAAKKRVPLLMSVPRGQAISEQSKNLLIKNFLKKPDAEKAKDADNGPPSTAAVETIVLD